MNRERTEAAVGITFGTLVAAVALLLFGGCAYDRPRPHLAPARNFVFEPDNQNQKTVSVLVRTTTKQKNHGSHESHE